MSPVCIDLFCGLGGWSEAFIAEGYECRGYDIEAHDYGTGGYPGTLHLRDVTEIHGSEFKDAAVIVASPPCQRYSYMAMPWSLAKAQIAMIEADETGEERRKLNLLFDACSRIQREASEAAGRHIPMVVENVRGAQRWVGQAPANYGSFYLWGDVGMVGRRVVCVIDRRVVGGNGVAPAAKGQKFNPDGTAHPTGSWFAVADSNNRGARDAVKVPGLDFNDRSSPGFNVAAAQRYREGTKQAGISGPRENGKGYKWFQDGAAKHGSKSNSRKAASAMIAKIPFPLAQHIARTFKPVTA